ncbi:16S rRNA (adenine(1518)-N(6)/adenine(1519)-N(6))-dimethyltransferase RsmA [Buchnera aphidicola (Macrosiphoniella sanborni)]|uniref:Ribosomal RNA small subunit methyltransferase A n=1 Tax=Buchnera aphidicola (Macrosiphoniella sanborni) TaxID=1241865 RepID=A0A4D6Y2G2_9GAMM|nr:16S rRNA (adenine(1518)-N(6)/adenine(1519)-N(6))-dimethyltransferase RsmA [Buchnera aphidicola]QCI23696.1 16S rRNA (adenine(1518)-N(6)/adenine(1519)-N(6))-dimethyltransferase RsmA [Buchnera aphidicola (Macrosiphoniella sanborni)]
MTQKKYKNIFPIKKFGQNFLINQKIVQSIITIINPKKKQILLEIGPGLGALTKPICRFLEKLIVIEIDPNILFFLKKELFYPKLIVFCQDALKFDYKYIFNQNNKLIRIFGNLPYNISTLLITHLFQNINIIQDMNFMLQREVAERLVAVPGNKNYCRLSIIAQYYCNIKILLYIQPENFYPIPKVHSVFVNLTPHIHSPYFVYDINLLSSITKNAFQNRRKILRHSLKIFFSEKDLVQLEINPNLRAENISIIKYCQLANNLYKKIKYSSKTNFDYSKDSKI